MNILLINTNPVVSRLISLCMRDEDTVFEEVTDVNAVALDRYDIVFVDDASYIDGLEDTLTNFMIRKKVFLSAKNSSEDSLDYFDEVIQKPFLPSQITSVLEGLDEIENDTKEITNEHFIFPLSTEGNTIEDEIEEEEIELEEPKKAEVLDSSEIERIKALLEDDDLELEPVEREHDIDYEARKVEVITKHLEADGLKIVKEEEFVETLSKKSKNSKKEKNKKSKKKKRKKTIEVCEGFPAEIILRKADELNCDVIVMGAHGKGIIANTFLGSTSKRVLRRTRKPVFIIPLPKGELDITFHDC